MKAILLYNPKLKEKARFLRNNSTLAEILLWKEIKNKQVLGYDFHRQKPILNYIVDFYSPELMLAIEIDGISHAGKYEYDIDREKQLKKLGVSLIRFRDEEVKKHIDICINQIKKWITQKIKPTPDPSKEGN